MSVLCSSNSPERHAIPSPPISFSRRRFLRSAAVLSAAAGLPAVVPSSVLGAAGRPAPSNRITVGAIGLGGQGSGNLGGFLGDPRCQVLAVNDVDRNACENARKRVNTFYSNQDCAGYKDFRELVARDDIDVISMATPDHWHAITVIASARAGKDIYGEKPFSHDLREGRAMVTALSQYGRVWQTGSWQRSTGDFRFACELVRNGRIGKVHTVEVGLPTGGPGGNAPFTNPPPELDYDFWCGPSPWHPIPRTARIGTGVGRWITAGASSWTGSAITATSLSGAWARNTPARWRSTPFSPSSPRRAFGMRRRAIASSAPMPTA